MKIGSLFSGYGGLDRAVQSVFPQAQTAWHCEFDKAPSAILNHHYPEVPNLHDVTQVDWEQVEPVDVITAGYPCQPFSVAGKRKGTNDERHLWPYVLAAIRILRPRFAVFENVAGHVGLGLDIVLGDLAKIGWDAQWRVIRASEIGAPHHRERLFILAHPSGQRPQAPGLSSEPAQEIAGDHDFHGFLARLNAAPDIEWELRNRWGEYGAAVLTWAISTRTVPPPLTIDYVATQTTLHPRFPDIRTGTNPEFIEWMMGLPDGWVTGVPGLTRTQQVRALGNGVVPQQAAAALKDMLA